MTHKATSSRRGHLVFAAGLLAAASNATPVLAQDCGAEIGRARAERLVRRCQAVSPATRPPCHADNPCALIEDEIRRGCGILADDAPGWCTER